MKTMQDLIVTIRALRKELGVPEKEPTPIHLHASNRVNALADQWYGERGNDYSAAAVFASRLREVLSEELLGSKEGSDDGSD